MRKLCCLLPIIIASAACFGPLTNPPVSISIVAVDSYGNRSATTLRSVATKKGSCNKTSDQLAITHSLVCDLGTVLEIVAAPTETGSFRLRKSAVVIGMDQVIIIPRDSPIDYAWPEPSKRLMIPDRYCDGSDIWLEFKRVNVDAVDLRLFPTSNCAVDLTTSYYGSYLVTAYRDAKPAGMTVYEHRPGAPNRSVRLTFTDISHPQGQQ